MKKIKNYLKGKIFLPEKPSSLTAKGWHDYRIEEKQKYPIRYFIHETCMNGIYIFKRKFITDPIWWIRHRTIDRYHVFYTGLKPGYHDKDEVLLYLNFNILVDFVEKEMGDGSIDGITALIDCINYEDYQPSAPQYGYTQKQAMEEILFLYYWWKNYRVKRICSLECQKARDIYAKREKIENPLFVLGRILSQEEKDMYDTSHKIDDIYEKEDSIMFLRLAKVRGHLWT